MSDIENLEQRLRALATAPGDADWKDVLRRAGHRISMRRAWPRLVLAAAVVVLAGLVAVLVLHGTRGASSGGAIGPPSTNGPTGPPGPAVGPTGLAHPLLSGQKVSLSDAENAFDGSVVLPDTSQVGPSDVGAVWLWLAPPVGPSTGQGVTAAAVTYPSQDLMIRYFRRPQYPNTFAFYEEMAKTAPGSQVISLNGIPALAVPQGPGGADWGTIQFILRGNVTYVMGHDGEAFLQTVAQSIVDRSSG